MRGFHKNDKNKNPLFSKTLVRRRVRNLIVITVLSWVLCTVLVFAYLWKLWGILVPAELLATASLVLGYFLTVVVILAVQICYVALFTTYALIQKRFFGRLVVVTGEVFTLSIGVKAREKEYRGVTFEVECSNKDFVLLKLPDRIPVIRVGERKETALQFIIYRKGRYRLRVVLKAEEPRREEPRVVEFVAVDPFLPVFIEELEEVFKETETAL